jgi:hypothetical protein
VPSDEKLYTLGKDQLESTERALFRELAAPGTSLPERQRVALVYVRILVERAVREKERALGLRHPRS